MVPNRRHASRLAVIPLLAVALVLAAEAAQEPSPGLAPQTVDEPTAAPLGLMELPRENLSPRLLVIRDLLEGRDKQLETELLKIQLRWARRENNREAVAQLEKTLARVEAGPKVAPPENRPLRERQR
jgi:hypothetical protein